jgi:SNF2 family DNA or RNA helicase
MFPRVMLAHGIKQYADFEARFLVQRRAFARGTTHMKVVGMRGDAEFRAILDEVMLQRTLDDIGADQPKLIWEVLPLDGESAAVKEATAKLPGLNSYENASHVRKLVGEAKAAVVAKMVVGQLRESDEKLVVFAHHTSVLERLAGALREANIQFSFVDGSVTPKKRDVALTEFRDNPKVQVFLAQNVACMAGIDLSAAASLLLIEPGWVASDNDQLGHRILGPNQKSRHVVAQMISLAGTIDDSIVRQNAREAAMQERIFGRNV